MRSLVWASTQHGRVFIRRGNQGLDTEERPCGEQGEGGHLQARERGSEEPEPASTPFSDLRPPGLGGKKLLPSSPICGVHYGRQIQIPTSHRTRVDKDLAVQKKTIQLLGADVREHAGLRLRKDFSHKTKQEN